MNILILNWKDIKHPNVGGAEIIVYELAKRMVKDGHSVTWFCRNYIYGKKQETIDGINIVRRGNLITAYFFAPIYYWKLPKKPDVVIDMSNTFYWQTPLWVTKSKRVAYLNQLAQEVFDYEFPKPISLIGKFLEKLQYLSYKNTTIITYSKSTGEDLVTMGIPRKNIYYFPIGLDHSRYLPGKKSKTPLFICVSRLVKMKRTELVIKAMEKVLKVYPEAKLIISGGGYERKKLELLRNFLGLEKSVQFLDENNWFFKKDEKDAKVKLMRSAWALVFPSVKEGWGMTVTECAACGTPAIATNVTGLCDSVVNGKTGILISKDPTIDELAKSMIKLAGDVNMRKIFSKNALLLSKKYTWEKSYLSFMKILNMLIEKKS